MKSDYHYCLRNGRNQHYGIYNAVVLGSAPGAESKKGYRQHCQDSAFHLPQKVYDEKERPR
jgi:hypothetical protein